MSPEYAHIQLEENVAERPRVKPTLMRYLQVAHADACRFFQEQMPAPPDPRVNEIMERAHNWYPAFVDRITLAGFFGEIIASLIAQEYEPHGKEWVVPAMPFRAHETLFRELISASVQGRNPGRTIGRLGDDCIAFSIDQEHKGLAAVLLCEAKCSYSHRHASIGEGHESLSDTSVLQLQFFKIIQVLRDRQAAGDSQWITAIQQLRDSMTSINDKKYDLFTYAYGKPTNNGTRLSTSAKHPSHTSPCTLVAAEVHFQDLESFATNLYREAFGHAPI